MKTLLILAALASVSCNTFLPSGDVQITSMQDCIPPTFITDSDCTHNPTGDNATTISCGGGASTDWAWPNVNCSGTSNVVAAVTLHASGLRNVGMPGDLTVYHKTNSRKILSQSSGSIMFVPEEKISVMMSPVIAFTQLSVDERADPDMITPKMGRDGVFSWNYEMYTTNFIPDTDCSYKSTSDKCCNSFRYPCGNGTDSATQDIDALASENRTGGVAGGVYKSCSGNLCSKHFGSKVSDWYPSDECAAMLSPDGATDTCWHNVCPGEFSDATLAKYVARGKCGNGIQRFFNNIAGQFSSKRVTKDNSCVDKGMLKSYNDHAQSVTRCKWKNGATINQGPVNVSLVGSQTINSLKKSYLVDTQKFNPLSVIGFRAPSQMLGILSTAANLLADGLKSPGKYRTKDWVRGWNGVVYQTKTTKCGQVHEVRADHFHYRTKVTVTAQNFGGQYSETVDIQSDSLPTAWINSKDCDIGGVGAPGCFRFKVISWDTSDNALEISKVNRGRFWLSYPWSATGDVNSKKNPTWENPWEDGQGSSSWMYSGGMTDDSSMFTPASLHGGISSYKNEGHNMDGNYVCAATAVMRNAQMMSIPGNSESQSSLYPSASRNKSSVYGLSTGDNVTIPPPSRSVSFSARAQTASGSVGAAGGSSLQDRMMTQANFVNMKLQNLQSNQAPNIVNGSKNTGGPGLTGPYMPWYGVQGAPTREGSTKVQRPFYWIDGAKMFHAQAYRTKSKVTVLLQFPQDNIVREQTVPCNSAELEWMACSSVRTTGSGGAVLRVKNTGAGWCMFWLNMSCDGNVVPYEAPSLSLASQNSSNINYRTFASTVGAYECSVSLKNNNGEVVGSASGNCTVVNYHRATSSAGIGVIPSCGVDCPQIGKNKTRKPGIPLWVWIVLAGVGVLSILGGIVKKRLDDKKVEETQKSGSRVI